MESLSQILADWGYWGLFFSAFIAGSILPFSSEAVMIVLVHMGLDPVLCVAAASLGNTLGGMSCYWIGTLGKSEWVTRLGVSEKQLARARRFLSGRGALMAFFAFLPTIGEAIAIVLGLMRSNVWLTGSSMLAGKTLRYIVVLATSKAPHRFSDMDLEIVKTDTPQRDLLLLADESEESVADYAGRGTTYVARRDGEILGQYVFLHTRPFTAEVVNIAVVPEHQRKGIATAMLRHAVATARAAGFHLLEIGTGDLGAGQIALYERCGFVRCGIDVDYFSKHYPVPFFENGVECRHMVRLRMELK